MIERINRIKVVLAEKQKTNKWLATVLVKIAKILDVELDELLNKEFIESI